MFQMKQLWCMKIFSKAINLVDDHAYHLKCERQDKADTSLRQILHQYGWSPKTPLERSLEYLETELSTAQYNDGSSTRFWYEHGRGDDFNPLEYFIKDPRGYSHITQSFMEDYITEGDNRLHLSQRVTDISQNETHVTVITSSGETFTGEYLINTVSLGVLQTGEINFSPPFEEDKFEAIMQHKMTVCVQAYLKFDESQPAFWDDRQWIVYAGPRWRYWHGWLNMNTLYPGCNILLAVVVGEEAVRVEQLSNAEVKEELMGVLRNIYGPDISEPVSVIVPQWSDLSSFR